MIQRAKKQKRQSRTLVKVSKVKVKVKVNEAAEQTVVAAEEVVVAGKKGFATIVENSGISRSSAAPNLENNLTFQFIL